MSVLIVGGDHLGNIEGRLKDIGYQEVLHITGRKIHSILVLTDYVNHNLSKEIKEKAKKQQVPIYFAKRSWSSIYQVLQGLSN
jgi:hypothetical protein